MILSIIHSVIIWAFPNKNKKHNPNGIAFFTLVGSGFHYSLFFACKQQASKKRAQTRRSIPNAYHTTLRSVQIFVFLLILGTSCSSSTTQKYTQNSILDFQSVEKDTSSIELPCKWDVILPKKGLVDIHKIDTSIQIELKYSDTNNFMHQDLYGCLNKCYLQPDVAKKLAKAQSKLQSIDSSLSLLIYDGLRPRSVQQKMWDDLDMPLYEKSRFVSNPTRGSLHNFGAAVDITLWDKNTQKPLDMGTPYDYIGLEAWPIKEQYFLNKGVLTQQQINNRKLLRKVMTKSGFFNIQSEWWHFNSCYRKEAYKKYQIVE